MEEESRAFYAVKVPLDPSPSQEIQFKSHAGGSRFAYNAALAHIKAQLDERKKQQEAGVDKKDLIRIDNNMISLGRWWRDNRDEIAPWHAENYSHMYNCAFQNLANASKNFLQSLTGKRKGERVAFPRFKKRSSTKTFAFPDSVRVADDHGIRLPKIGRVHTLRNVRKLVGDRKIKTTTVKFEGGRWYASLLCETIVTTQEKKRHQKTVGVDLGIKELATLSDGVVFHNPAPLREAKRRLAHAQRALARKEKGSNHYFEQQQKVNRIYARVRFLRNNTIHQLTAYLTDHYTDIYIEDLNVKGMLKNHGIAGALSDAALAEIRRQLEYKANKKGVRIHVIDRFYPSTKTCSGCGSVKDQMSLSERTYLCDRCGLEIDRDLNAAINIERKGLEELGQNSNQVD